MAKPKNIPDPLEAAKGEEPSASIADGNSLDSPVAAATADVQPPLADLEAEIAAPPSEEPVIVPPPAVKTPRYVVNKEKTISYGASMVRLRVGKIISAEMGERFMQACREWGVDMTLLEE